MEQNASADRLDPAVKRDLFFGDWVLTRREVVVSIIATIATLLLVLIGIRTRGMWRDLAITNSWIAFFWWAQTANRVRRAAGAAKSVFRNPIDDLRRPRVAEALEALRVQAAEDPDLAIDARLTSETARIQPIRAFSRVVVLLQAGVLLAVWIVLVQQTVVDLRAAFRPAPPRVELVDVVLVQGAPDFQGPMTIDLTGGRVTQISPYDLNRTSRVGSLRAFVAIGKYLVAGEAIDLSRPDWLTRFRASWMRPIDLGTTGDFLVVDLDPRSHDLAVSHVAAAVIGGRYYSREDLQQASH